MSKSSTTVILKEGVEAFHFTLLGVAICMAHKSWGDRQGELLVLWVDFWGFCYFVLVSLYKLKYKLLNEFTDELSYV
jgi:hypothetical protein